MPIFLHQGTDKFCDQLPVFKMDESHGLIRTGGGTGTAPFTKVRVYLGYATHDGDSAVRAGIRALTTAHKAA